MKYLLMIYTSETEFVKQSEAEQQANWSGYFAFNQEATQRGALLGGEALMPMMTATTVRVREAQILHTDGPFAETKEQLCGYYLLDCKDLDEAMEWAAKIPNAKFGTIEIRPIMHTGQ